ncbi:TauD/TfdA family dioxygenase [Nocardia sp. alder85J]|uniref:TauD/TfdA family dioxygenase n=1 Tax=Nocardia sp. alder85J TaxID=2862949 RepID=UPI001CD6C85B|nr:TauD/TfdA family dioxygenase [Nocardia sp. alder85J]MCX4097767.1 TauD/TfdA family dioxygenase [Nocardia sp. alder85J]
MTSVSFLHTDSRTSEVPITAWHTGTRAPVQRLRSACRTHGFAVFTVADPAAPARQILTEVADRLDLGAIHIPPVYAPEPGRFGYSTDGFNTIAPTVTADGHRYFGTGAAQGFHTDGTLEPIGLVATSLLWFERAAPGGGHTTIFDAVAAYTHLRSTDPALAQSLTGMDALTRVATAFTPPRKATGPAFAQIGGRWRTRWADDGTEIWQLAGDLGAVRAAAVESMRRLSRPGSPFRHELPIPSRTGLVLCNSVVAHGRTAFCAGPGGRLLIRGLYTREVA